MARTHKGRAADKDILDGELVVSRMPMAFLQCRTLGHAWNIEWWGPAKLLAEIGLEIPPMVNSFRWTMVRVSHCLRCATERDEFYPAGTIDPYDMWRVQQRRYRYTDGYQLRGYPQVDRRFFSHAGYERWMETHEADKLGTHLKSIEGGQAVKGRKAAG